MSAVNFTADFATDFLMFFDEDLEEPNISSLAIKVTVLAVSCIAALWLIRDTWDCNENVRASLQRGMTHQENETRTDSRRLRWTQGDINGYYRLPRI